MCMYPDSMQQVFTKERAGKWSFDGHGINCDGKRIFTGGLPRYINDENDVQENPEHHVTGKVLTGFANQAHRLWVRHYSNSDPDRAPTIHLDLDIDDIRKEPANSAHVLAIEVKLPNGKTGRIHLSLQAHDTQNRVKAIVRTPGREINDETEKSVAVKFADWDKPLD